MAPLGSPISAPSPQRHDRVELRLIRSRDARVLERLLRENRRWLEEWEATHPHGATAAPGSVSMRPTIRSMRLQMNAGSGVPFVMTYDGEVVGQLNVSEISGGALRSAQIGYWISETVAGRGVTPVGVALAIDYLMRDLRLHRVEICIRPENTASIRVVEKLGMRFEGKRDAYIHIAGEWRDHVCFAVTAEEIPHGMLTRLLAHGESSTA